ncbi:MAG: class I SAM-dependent methyltransferase [Oscillatoria princeps RMCB-10]|nr:class I SAM-dependent methyltransferase [Oscillatoria princeps RMCB-10]
MQSRSNPRIIPSNQSWCRQYRSNGDSSSRQPSSPEVERHISALEEEIATLKLPDYYPTPQPVIQRMIQLAGVRSGQKVLEPSAGKGNIAEALSETGGIDLEVIESQPPLREILALKGYKIVGNDFLQHETRYDRIVMNPPFSGGFDSVHIRHAYECLRPNGRLVSVLCHCRFFRDDRKCDSFRNWLLKVGAQVEKLPSTAFFHGERPTYVPTSLVVVSKPRR